MFKSLQNKLLMLNMVITSLVILGAFGAVYLTTYNNIKAENEGKLEELTETSTGVHGGHDDSESDSLNSHDLENVIAKDYSPCFILLLNADGEIMERESFFDFPAEVYVAAASLGTKDASNVQVDFYGRQWLYSASPYQDTHIDADGASREILEGSYKVAFLDITETQKTLHNLLLTFSIVGFIVLIVIFFVSYYFAKRAIRPIAAAWERQRQFVADASHELKTPLAIITTNYDVLLTREEETIKSQKQWLQYLKIGTDRMTKLLNSLLALVQMENEDVAVVKTTFNLSEAISETMGAMAMLAQAKELTLRQSLEPQMLIETDRDLILQVFTILYENAIKYANTHGTVEVTLTKSGHKAICTLGNSGSGIKKQDLEKIFYRFYRLDPSRHGENGGHGLGLPIAKAAIERLHGSISVTSKENEWTVFTVTIGEVK